MVLHLPVLVGQDLPDLTRKMHPVLKPHLQIMGCLLNPGLGPQILCHPLGNQRFGQGPDINLRLQFASHPFNHHHGLLQQQQFRLGLHLEAFSDGKQTEEQFGQ